MTPNTLARIHAAAFTHDRSWTAQEFRDLQARPHTHLTKARNGFALWRSIADEAELLTIAVDPAEQNKGTGRSLMGAWMTKAAETAETAFLEVAADNLTACRLYRHFGFRTVATRRNYYARPDGHADALVMRAPLPFSVP
ncbi:ribosomal protein S18-alanine N-acetyltransferase [Tateyamaria pelophila]|uniref:ribosomal protein S18-alanine N-acetyltransferase n=1 Tax=Tateyamaria pelophila TaxID=328415 RepID=UPI001CBB0B14|nr:ribosomal protein S18-alanine N-acetyltransferase [Tateyamaria pelophila]